MGGFISVLIGSHTTINENVSIRGESQRLNAPTSPSPPRGTYFVKIHHFCVVRHFDLTFFGVFYTIKGGSLDFR